MNRQLATEPDTESSDPLDNAENYPVLFEVAPPQVGNEKKRFRRHCEYLEMLFERLPVHAINIPEIHDESGKNDRGKRRNDFKRRVPPRRYARRLSEVFDTNFIINRVAVQAPAAEQEEWLLETYHEYDIDTIVLVGGESGSIEYRGPSVTEMNSLARDHLNRGKLKHGDNPADPTNFIIGNISIPTRRRSDFDEPERMWRKVQSGAEFFTTQIVLDDRSPFRLLRDFSLLLDQKPARVPTLFWSFSPIAEKKDVDFLRWLGVRIPDERADRILSAPDPVSESIDWTMETWQRLQEVNRELPVSLSLGINISVMGLRNFENGIRMAETLNAVTVTS